MDLIHMEMKQNNIRQQENQFKGFIKKVIDKSFELGLIKIESKIIQSSTEEDTKLSFDLIYSTELTISVRLRKYKFSSYDDFTIRSKSNYGGLTEIDKLFQGMGYIYFYGYTDPTETKIIKWVLFYIDPIRKLLYENGRVFNNTYDMTQLKAYKFQFLVDNNALIAYGYFNKGHQFRKNKELNFDINI